MDTAYYIDIFEKLAAQLDKKLLKQKQMMSAVVIYGNSVVLKLCKPGWANAYLMHYRLSQEFFFQSG